MKLINYLKNFVPLDVLYNIKYNVGFKKQKTIKLCSEKRIFYLDAPRYPNMGDQAIAVGIRRFANTLFPEYEFVEILQEEYHFYEKWLKKTIRGDDIIFLTGGGNMGNYYRTFEAARRHIIKTFLNNRIIIFPQSINYSKDFWGRVSQKRSSKIYSKNNKLVICAREIYSYETMKKIYSNQIIKCPDIVLSLEKVNCSKKNYLGVCLRSDIEQKITKEEKDELMRELGSWGETELHTISTIEGGIYTEQNREKAVIEKIHEVGQCQVIVTDRLHAMIFAVLSGTPCVVIPNNNKKIMGTLEWFGENGCVRMVDNIRDVSSALGEVKKTEGNIELDYSELICAIKGQKCEVSI